MVLKWQIQVSDSVLGTEKRNLKLKCKPPFIACSFPSVNTKACSITGVINAVAHSLQCKCARVTKDKRVRMKWQRWFSPVNSCDFVYRV